MTTTPRLWKPQTQVNTADSGAQTDGQIAATHDGGYVVIWHSLNFTIGQRYDSGGNKLNSEVIAGFNFGEQTTPAVTVLANGNIAVAVADTSTPSIYVNIFSPTWGSPLRTDFIDGGTDLSSPSITPFADGSYVISYTDGAGLDNSNNSDGLPMLVVFSTCIDFIRTVPFLQHDPDRPEDVMTDSEDHCGDEARYACMSRPWVPMKEAPRPENISGYRPYRTDVQSGDWLTY